MSKLIQEHYFLKVSLAFETPPDIPLGDRLQLKAMVVQALQTLHGEVGAAVPVDVLKCSSSSTTGLEAILRTPHRWYWMAQTLHPLYCSELVKVWSALTLMGRHSGTTCVFTVQKVSGSLLSLAESSREFEFPKS